MIEVINQFINPWWRLTNLYYILDKDGHKVKFYPNDAQTKFMRDMWYQNVILKARQRGFSTVIQLFILDAALWNNNIKAGVIAHTLEDVEAIFNNKLKFAYDNLQEGIRLNNPLITNSKRNLELSNGSMVRVGQSLRSDTFQYLHISEFGKICAKFPDKAQEIMTGTLPTVQAGNFVFIESTSDGTEGPFHDMCKESEARSFIDRPLNIMERKFHFYSWWDADEYEIDPDGVIITIEDAQYFERVEAKIRHPLSLRKRAWYVLKRAEIGGSENMMQEYPSTSDESFNNSTEGSYYSQQLAVVRKQGRICKVPTLDLPVNTFWDIGNSDGCGIWFHQQVGLEDRFIKYLEAHGETLMYYMKELQDTGYIWGKHFLPHDAGHERLSDDNKSIEAQLNGLGLRNTMVLDRCDNVNAAIQLTRGAMASCYFDEVGCALGIKRLENYKKRWNDRQGRWSDEPNHDINAEGADSFRQFAQAKDDGLLKGRSGSTTKKKAPGSWRTR